MDTVRVEGVTYTKVATIAKKFRYTTDYVGQLCRNGKVDCQFVGRAWYVSEESLLKHKDGRYIESRQSEKNKNNNSGTESNSDVISVSPRLKNVTAKRLQENKSHFLTRLEVGDSKYYADETELLPQPLKTAASQRIAPIVPVPVAIEPAEAISVRVVATTKPKKLDFTDVPAVALRGQLAVHEVVVGDDSAMVTASDIADLLPEAVVAEPKVVTVPKIAAKPAVQASLVRQHKAVSTPSVYTPQVMIATANPSRLGLLLTVATVASSIFAGFFVSAFQVFTIDGSNVSASIMFSLEALLKLL
ncbi:MAG: hypothetical protein MUF19_00570 [Candidatus Pacebacteria bacterium]|jgi:hypothetical protein|nr:hypothetical protein [Candidatus Paceibacterota bacterium]